MPMTVTVIRILVLKNFSHFHLRLDQYLYESISISKSVSTDCWCNQSWFGLFVNFATFGKCDPRLSCSCLVGLILMHSKAIPLPTAGLKNSKYSQSSFVPAVCSLTIWGRWFRKLRYLCPTKFGYSQPLSHLLWYQNNHNCPLFCPSWIHWLPILALLELLRVNFVILSCRPRGVVARNYRFQEWFHRDQAFVG